MEKLYALDLFSGIGGNTLGLNDYIRTIAYCEFERHAQGVLLSRMRSGDIKPAPIWDDVRTLGKAQFATPVDIVLGGFPCQVYPWPVKELGSHPRPDQACSTRSSDSSTNSSLPLFFSKMSQPLEPEDSTSFYTNLPKQGMIVDGQCYRLPQSVPFISARDGSSLPTPTATPYSSNIGGAQGRTGKIRYSLNSMAQKNLWPTPTVSQKTYDNQKDGSRTYSLTGMATHNLWPTPSARDWKDNGKSPAELAKKTKTSASLAGGPLNPTWVEWLMGFPLEWTVLNDLETQWYQPKRKQRSKS
jgi:hypothetical protein